MKTVTISILEPGTTIKIHEGPFDENHGTVHDCTANIPDDAWNYIERELAGGEKDGAYPSDDDGKLYIFRVRDDRSKAAAILGTAGGSAKSPAKAKTSRENGRKGGRPVQGNIYRVAGKNFARLSEAREHKRQLKRSMPICTIFKREERLNDVMWIPFE